jgi:hypothetical protein
MIDDEAKVLLRAILAELTVANEIAMHDVPKHIRVHAPDGGDQLQPHPLREKVEHIRSIMS